MEELRNLKYEDYAMQDMVCFNKLKVGDLIYNDVQEKFMKIVGIFQEGSLMRITFLDKKDIPLVKDVRENRTLESIGIALCKNKVLDPIEKEYLKNFLKPYMKDYEIRIIKRVSDFSDNARIEIQLFYKAELECAFYKYTLPPFNKDKMYKKMEADKVYKLEDLI